MSLIKDYVVSYAVLDVVYGLDVYRANLKLFPPLAKLCVPESSSPLNAFGITFAIYYLLIMVMVIAKEYE